MSHPFSQKRAQPEAWNDLSTTANAASQQYSAPQQETLRELSIQLDRMGLLELDKNRYFAMGQTICELAQVVSQPDRRAFIVEAGAAQLTFVSAKTYSGGISGLSNLVINRAFEAECFQAYSRLPAGVQLLGDYLHIVSDTRRIEPDFYKSPYYEHGAFAANYFVAQKKGGSSMVAHLRSSVASATSLVFEAILSGPSGSKREANIAKGELPTAENIAALSHPSVAEVIEKCAALRFGRFLNGVGSAVAPQEDGSTVFDRNAIQPSNQADEIDYGWLGKDYFVRDNSIVCPAATIEGVLPLIAGMVADMIEKSVRERTIPA